MAVLKNRVGVTTASVGTGTITLGAAIGAVAVNAATWQTFAAGGVASGDSVRYLILDVNGAWEYGPGIFSSGPGTLTRAGGAMDGSIAGQKSSTGALLALSGLAQVFITAVAEDLVPFDSPAFTGNPVAPTQASTDNSTRIATTGFVKAQGYLTAASAGTTFAPIDAPVFTGDARAVTPGLTDNDTSIATTAFVKGQGYAPLADPVFTGTPTAPLPTPASNSTTQIATTAFVQAAASAAAGGAASDRVLRAGDTMTGDLTIDAVSPEIILNKTALVGELCQFLGTRGANSRWACVLGDSANEAGGNAGSNYALLRFDDDGTPHTAMAALRTGLISILDPVTAPTPASNDNSQKVATTFFVRDVASTSFSVCGLQGSSTNSNATFTFAECALRTASGATHFMGGATFTVTPGNPAGAGGPDVALAASGDVYFYAIWGSVPGVAGICSANGPAQGGPTLPSGYTHWCFLTVLKRNAGTLYLTWIRGDKVYYNTAARVLTNANSGGSWTPFSVSAFVPLAAHTIMAGAYANATGSPASVIFFTLGVSSGATMYSVRIDISVNALLTSQVMFNSFPNVSQTLYHSFTISGGSFTASNFTFDVIGYEVPNAA